MMKKWRVLSFVLVIALMTSLMPVLNVSARDELEDARAIWMNPANPIETRVEALLSQMTVAEKVGQTTQLERDTSGTDYANGAANIKNYFIGSILSGGGATPTTNTLVGWQTMINIFQDAALSTRLGIPIIYEIDAVHGDGNVSGVTIFPHNVGLGATRNAALVKEVGRITAKEMRAASHVGNFNPCIPSPQNVRWGRTYEGYGSSYAMNALLGSAYVEGLQGGRPVDATALNTDAAHLNQFPFLANKTSAAATMKHYFGEGEIYVPGVNQGNCLIPELPTPGNLTGWTPAQLRAVPLISRLLEPYAALVEAGARSMMPSYNSINGVKMHQQKELIDLLKLPKDQGGLGFTGFVVSDYNANNQLNGSTNKIKNAQMINAGTDLAMVPAASNTTSATGYIPTMLENIADGSVSMERLNDAVRRILRVKFEMGLFENPKPFIDDLMSEVRSPEHLAVARQAVRESLVLLKNKNDIVSSLKNMNNLMVVGRFADNLGNQCGGWTIQWQGATSAADIAKLQGTSILKAIQDTGKTVGYNATGARNTDDTTNYDAIILTVGETPYAEGNGDANPNSAGSRNTLQMDYADVQVINNVLRDFPGVPIICVSFFGRPMIIEKYIDLFDAFVAAWWCGTEANGITDVLFGDYDFVGKTPYAWGWYSEWVPDKDGIYPVMWPAGYGLKKGETGAPLVKPARQVTPYIIAATGTTNIASGSPVYNRYGYLSSSTLATPRSNGTGLTAWGDANWFEYQVNVKTTGTYTFGITFIRNQVTENLFTVSVDGEQKAVIAPTTASSSSRTLTADIDLAAGMHVIRVNIAVGTGSYATTVSNLSFALASSTVPPVTLNVVAPILVAGFDAKPKFEAAVPDGAVISVVRNNITLGEGTFKDGKAYVSLSKTAIATAGNYSLFVTSGGEGVAEGVLTVKAPAADASGATIWAPVVKSLSNSVYVYFSEKIAMTDKTVITHNSKVTTATSDGDKTLLLTDDFDKFDDTNTIVLTNIKYPELFPSYKFTFTTTFNK